MSSAAVSANACMSRATETTSLNAAGSLCEVLARKDVGQDSARMRMLSETIYALLRMPKRDLTTAHEQPSKSIAIGRPR